MTGSVHFVDGRVVVSVPESPGGTHFEVGRRHATATGVEWMDVRIDGGRAYLRINPVAVQPPYTRLADVIYAITERAVHIPDSPLWATVPLGPAPEAIWMVTRINPDWYLADLADWVYQHHEQKAYDGNNRVRPLRRRS